ncbi:MAG: beta-glucosidase BglX [Flavobacteriales bacterium]|nr:beta-glucosidase BglX [Flavobacteriales bacterium]
MINKYFSICSWSFLFLFLSCNSQNIETAILSVIDMKVVSFFSLMTLQEKIGQLNQYSVGEEMTGPNQDNEDSKKRYQQLINGDVGSVLNLLGAENTRLLQEQVINNTRLKIPLIFAYDVIHGYKTIFPIPLGESCSWDLDIIEKTAKIAAKEAAASGVQWTFAPMVDISRDARWGRVMEGAGEDPFLGSKIADARIKGFQGNSLDEPFTIAACAKHFAGYGFVESGKDYNIVNVGKNTLMNVILPPFKQAANSNVATFMNAFNDIDGTPASANNFILRDLLKRDWNFDGVVVSDWNSIGEMVNHRTAKNLRSAAEQALIAGCDIDMEATAYVDHLDSLVKDNPDLLIHVDEAVKRVLKLKFELGLFEDPFRYCNIELEKETVGAKEHFELAEKAALNSIVLLKNSKNVLPLIEKKKIAVIGPLANDGDTPLGNWRGKGEQNSATSLVEGMKMVLKNNSINYTKGCELSIGNNNFFQELKINKTDRNGFKEAIELAKSSDVVVMALGEPAYMSGEGRSRADIGLPGLQLELLKEVYAVNKNIVLVLMNGRPMTLTWENEHIPAIIETWHLGSRAGIAIAKVLAGVHNPSGKLTMSFPKHVGQLPIYYNHKNTGRPTSGPNQVFYSHHTDIDNNPLYPFGYGLSYTSFDYSDITLSNDSLDFNSSIEASVDVTNTGGVDGAEIVQMYITDHFASVTLPNIELKGFKKIYLRKGETQTVSFVVDSDLLRFYNDSNNFISEAGSFSLKISTSSSTGDMKSFELYQ